MKFLDDALKMLRKPLVEGKGIKVFQLNEGTWSAPQTLSQARRLAKLMNKPIMASQASEVLYDLMGDDQLFDRIADVARPGEADVDVRWLVAKQLRQWLKWYKQDPGSWSRPWDPEAIKILEKLWMKHAR